MSVHGLLLLGLLVFINATMQAETELIWNSSAEDSWSSEGVWRNPSGNEVSWENGAAARFPSLKATEIFVDIPSEVVATSARSEKSQLHLSGTGPLVLSCDSTANPIHVLAMPTGITLDVPLTTKADVLRALSTLAEATGLLYDRDHLLASLVDRESLCSTAMPGGVALCHPRRPIPSIIQRQFLCFLRTPTPVNFGAEDGDGTSLFFLLCTPDDRSHLHGLARLARVLHGGTLDALKNAASSDEVVAVLANAESQIRPDA